MEPVEVGIEPPRGWASVVYAKDQPEYLPLPTIVSADGRVVSRWRPSPEEREKLMRGEDIFVTMLTFRSPLQPVMITVGGAPVEPMT